MENQQNLKNNTTLKGKVMGDEVQKNLLVDIALEVQQCSSTYNL